jgi:hypothetical protein
MHLVNGMKYGGIQYAAQSSSVSTETYKKTKFSNENISFSKEIKIQDEIHTPSVGNIFLQDGENQI